MRHYYYYCTTHCRNCCDCNHPVYIPTIKDKEPDNTKPVVVGNGYGGCNGYIPNYGKIEKVEGFND